MEVRSQVGTGGEQAWEKMICLDWGPLSSGDLEAPRRDIQCPLGPWVWAGGIELEVIGIWTGVVIHWDGLAPSAPRPGVPPLRVPSCSPQLRLTPLPSHPLTKPWILHSSWFLCAFCPGGKVHSFLRFSNLLVTSEKLKRSWKDSHWAQRCRRGHVEERWIQREHFGGERSP